jgi:hypothetical protein
MLYTTPERTLRLALSDLNQQLLEFIDDRKYKVSNAETTYRRIHLMGKQGILSASQKEEGKWRRFSLCELIFLVVSNKLREYGINSLQLMGLHDAFFEEDGKKSTFHSDGTRAIALVFSRIQVILSFSSDGEVDFYDEENFMKEGARRADFIFINFNELINDLLKRLGHDQQFDYRTALAIFLDALTQKTKLNQKEKKVIELIRAGRYEFLEIKLKNDEILKIEGSIRREGDLSPSDYAYIVKNGMYREISITERGGEVVTYAIKDSIKF